MTIHQAIDPNKMKSIFDKPTREELIARINAVDANAQPLWGKMNVYQMMKHCTLWEEMIAGKRVYKRVFAGHIFGRLVLKNFMKDDKPMMHNARSIKELIITETGDVAAQKRAWITELEGQANFANDNFVHPFFGKMTKQQIGQLAYKHSDHHLRQFGA